MSNRSIRVLLAVWGMLPLIVLAACAPPASDITIKDAWARPAAIMNGDTMNREATAEPPAGLDMPMESTPEPGMEMSGTATSAVYMTIENSAGADDALTVVSVSGDIAGAAELHQTTVE